MARWLFGVVVVAACGQDTAPCEENDVPTCESELIVQFRDGRSGDFRFRLRDDVSMNLDIQCPDEDTGLNEIDGYTWVCGQGRVTVNTSRPFGDVIYVGVGGAPEEAVEWEFARGGDKCGNPCTRGTIEL